MAKLKLVLICVVALLGAAVVYGYVDDSDSETAAPSSADRSNPAAEAPSPSAGADDDDEVDGEELGVRPEGEGTSPSGAGGEAPDPRKPTDASGAEEQAQGAGGMGGTESDQSAPDQDAAPAKSEYVASVDAICGKVPRRFASRAQKAAAKAQKRGAGEVEDAYRQAIVRTLKQTAREIEALTPPPGDEQEVAALVAAMEKATRNIARQPLLDVGSETSVLTEFAKRSKRYGLARCSQF